MSIVSRIRLLIIALVSFLGVTSTGFNAKATESTYDFSFKALTGGGEIKLSDYKGKVILVVNTASNCGFTGQLEDLQKLYEKYQDKGLVVIGVPSNDFGAQEPGSSEEIASFCKINYGVTFPMTTKQVVSGENAHPFYKWARKELGFGSGPKWNFHKYLINSEGRIYESFGATTNPKSKRLEKAILSGMR